MSDKVGILFSSITTKELESIGETIISVLDSDCDEKNETISNKGYPKSMLWAQEYHHV